MFLCWAMSTTSISIIFKASSTLSLRLTGLFRATEAILGYSGFTNVRIKKYEIMWNSDAYRHYIQTYITAYIAHTPATQPNGIFQRTHAAMWQRMWEDWFKVKMLSSLISPPQQLSVSNFAIPIIFGFSYVRITSKKAHIHLFCVHIEQHQQQQPILAFFTSFLHFTYTIFIIILCSDSPRYIKKIV